MRLVNQHPVPVSDAGCNFVRTTLAPSGPEGYAVHRASNPFGTGDNWLMLVGTKEGAGEPYLRKQPGVTVLE
ncbi:MAG: hypothetical protein COY66_05605 [Candidatus Kerfeldbacteria bacterium CG_4_10_14_0_8_um_filter_42_10]|uniref:Uncharacterized protein n=1 Tax=Candidatus Kerfeldbacteria bacterium CG_4_10_14_0_8_um_filter_42_10 TaxID=2014248 RepID=A0A2M7RGR7_9BACT|nr:MAG: hypothetical protein COY66_05605 [Candidatus Kerfeldbacteria bacterium CG_4_10_14_0_8_um_filter_42_10]